MYHAEVINVRILTLKPGAVYANVSPTTRLLSWGVTIFGAVGVLLSVSAPVNSWTVAVSSTEKGSWKVTFDTAPTVFTT